MVPRVGTLQGPAKWWQVEPKASLANTAMGLCIDEDFAAVPLARLWQ